MVVLRAVGGVAGQGKRLVSVGLGLALLFVSLVSVTDQARGEELVRGVLAIGPGYSFVSLPCVNTSFTASSFLDALGDAAKSISYYDPATQSYVTYDRNLVRFGVQENFLIHPDVGYVVYSTEDCSTRIDGVDTGTRSIHLRPGYNLVGWSSPLESDPVTAFINTSNGSVQSVSTFDQPTQQWIAYDKNLAEIGVPQPDFDVRQGEAYYVYSKDERVLRYDSVNATMTSFGFVYVRDGKFFASDNSEVSFLGVNFASMLSPYVYNAYESEEDFKKMREYGFNFIRLPLSWKHLQPTKGSYNATYLARIDRVLDWASKYGTYVMLTLMEICPRTRPTWIVDRAELWNPTVLQEVYNTWGYLASRYRDRTVVIGYEVPYAEPEWPADGSAEKYQLANWNTWLKAMYGSIEALGNSWAAEEGSRLSTTEDDFGKIQFRKPGGYGYNRNENTRLYDFNRWFGDLYFNVTQNCINAIRAHDTRHLIIQADEFTRFPDGRCLLTSKARWDVPEEISARCQEFYYAYMTYWTKTGDYTNETIKSGGEYCYLQRERTSRTLPIILSETGARSNEEPVQHWTQTTVMNALEAGVNGIAIWSWVATDLGQNDYIIIDADRNFRPGFEFIPGVAQAFVNRQHKIPAPQVAVVGASRGGTSRNNLVLVIAEALRQLSIDFRLVSDDFVVQNSSALNPYKVVFVVPDHMNITAIERVKDFALREDRWAFWYGGMERDAYRRSLGDGYAAYTAGMKDDSDCGSGKNYDYNVDQILRCTSPGGWGDLAEGETLIYRAGAHLRLTITDSDLIGTGAVPRITIPDRNNEIALWTKERSAYFYDGYYVYDKDVIGGNGIRRVIQAFLSSARIPDFTT